MATSVTRTGDGTGAGSRGAARCAPVGSGGTADRGGWDSGARTGGHPGAPRGRRPVEERDDVRVEAVVGVRGPAGGISHGRIMAQHPLRSAPAAPVGEPDAAQSPH